MDLFRDDATPAGLVVSLYFVGAFGVVLAVNLVFHGLGDPDLSGLSSDHAYEEGLRYNERIAAERAQEKLGWSIKAEVRPSDAGRPHSATIVVSVQDKGWPSGDRAGGYRQISSAPPPPATTVRRLSPSRARDPPIFWRLRCLGGDSGKWPLSHSAVTRLTGSLNASISPDDVLHALRLRGWSRVDRRRRFLLPGLPGRLRPWSMGWARPILPAAQHRSRAKAAASGRRRRPGRLQPAGEARRRRIATLHLMVEGKQCAACVWLIESVLARQPGIGRGASQYDDPPAGCSLDRGGSRCQQHSGAGDSPSAIGCSPMIR